MRPDTVLAFDTSAAHCAAALLLPDGRCLGRDEPMQKGQAERLVPMLEELLAEAGIGWPELGRIAVGIGPGNFTGVRIAVATARGLALALGIPAVGVTRLEALAHGLPRPLRVVEDARQGLAYVQDFPGGAARLAPLAGLAGFAGAVTGSAAGPDGLPPAGPIAGAIARIGRDRVPGAAPAPYYLKGADAAPPSDPPPVILP
ncbi:MAG: tRNA (adenosine(37)-N6)-threonylcarbamoyltransferase complex dimerization subunit type 1 TsaB [Paracoccaceae bacterium]